MGDVGRWGTPHGRPEGSPPISKGQEDSHMTVNNVTYDCELYSKDRIQLQQQMPSNS
jgi:hypothetical protein